MIVFLLNAYIAVLAILVWMKVVPFNLFWKVSPALVLVALTVGLFIPMGWGAPSGPVLVVRHSVAIVPNVAGEVIEVPVTANAPLKAGDVLFRIDPTPFESDVRALEAQAKLADLRLGQISQLQAKDAASLFNVQERQSEADRLHAQLDAARWNLDSTTVRAPADGFVTNLALRKGARVATLPLSPAMAFFDTSETLVVMEVAQIDARYVAVGQATEVTFKYFPGQIFVGQVQAILPAVATGQAAPSGSAVAPERIVAAPFVVRLALDDATTLAKLPAGSAGDAAIFTEHVTMSHVIRRVMLRMTAILNFVVPE